MQDFQAHVSNTCTHAGECTFPTSSYLLHDFNYKPLSNDCGHCHISPVCTKTWKKKTGKALTQLDFEAE